MLSASSARGVRTADNVGDRLRNADGGHPAGEGRRGGGPRRNGLRRVGFGDEHRRRLTALIAANVATLNDLLRRNRAGFSAIMSRQRSLAERASFAGSIWPAGPRPSAWSRRRPFAGSTFKRCWTAQGDRPADGRRPWRSWPNCAVANGPTPTPCRERSVAAGLGAGSLSPRMREVRKELRQLIRSTHETPASLARRLHRIAGPADTRAARQDLSAANLRLVVALPNGTATGASASST